MEKHSLYTGLRNLLLVSVTGFISTFANVTEAAISSKQTPERVEMVFWSAIENSTNPEEFLAYIEEFPEGRFVLLAKVRAKALGGVVTPGSSVQATVPPGSPALEREAISTTVEATESSLPDNSSVVPGRNTVEETTSSAAATPGAWKRGGWKPEITEEEIISPDTSSTDTTRESTVAMPGAWKRGSWKTGTVSADISVPKTTMNKSSKPALAAVLPVDTTPDSFRDCGDCPEMIGLATGQYTMGSDNENDRAFPPHAVSIDYPFSISRFEITTDQWNLCVDKGGCTENEENRINESDRTPAINISWQDTQDYVEWISETTGNEYRLPTEAEWEYAARAGTSSDYWWGNEPENALANCRGCGGYWEQKLPANIDEFPANAFGLHAMLGGVSEWVQDCWNSTFSNSPADGTPYETGDCTVGVLRGGSWKNDSRYLRSATRTKFDQDVRYLTNGFRIVRMK